MSAPKPIGPWHGLVIKQFSGRTFYDVLNYLKRKTGTSWYMSTQQSERPPRVTMIFRDEGKRIENLFMRITGTGPRTALVEAGQMGWRAGLDFKVRYRNSVPLDQVGNYPPFEWVEREGLEMSRHRLAQKISKAYIMKRSSVIE